MSKMSENVGKKNRALAMKLVAEDRLSDDKIAAKCGVNPRTLTRWRKDAEFVKAVAQVKAGMVAGAEKAAEATGFDTVKRLAELAAMSPEKTNGTITGQVRACMGIAEIRGEVVKLHGDVTDRLRNKTPEELDFIAIHRRDPKDAEELQQFVEARTKSIQ